MPTRLVREGILSSDSVAKLSWGAECFYRRLMSVVDDFGRFDGRTIVLRAALYPVQVDKVNESEVAAWKREAASAGLVTCYVVEGKEFVQIEKFGTPRAKASKFPAPNLQTQTDANTCAQMQTDANGCEQTQTDESKRKQVRASVPYSYSDSNAHSDSSSNTPPPPTGEHPRKVFDPLNAEIPQSLDTPEFRASWAEWVAYRNGMPGKKLKQQSWIKQLRAFEAHGVAAAVWSINQSIQQGWTGVFPDKYDANYLLGLGKSGAREKPTGAAKLPPSTVVPEFIMLWEHASNHAGLDRWFLAQTRLAHTPENRRKIHSLRNYHARKLDGADPDGKKTANNLHSDVKAWWQGRDFADMTNRDDWEAADAIIAGLDAGQ